MKCIAAPGCVIYFLCQDREYLTRRIQMLAIFIELLLLVLAIAGAIGSFGDWHATSKDGDLDADRPVNVQSDTGTLPESGSYIRHQSPRAGEVLVQLRNMESTDRANCYCTFIDETSKKPVITVFVRGNQKAIFLLAPGRYSIKYLRGMHWYGANKKFGASAKEGTTEATYIGDAAPVQLTPFLVVKRTAN